MLEKVAIAGLLGLGASLSYVGVSDQSAADRGKMQLTAASRQEQEIRNALELYWLQKSRYPEVRDEAVLEVLRGATLLPRDAAQYDIKYRTSDGLNYELSVS